MPRPAPYLLLPVALLFLVGWGSASEVGTPLQPQDSREASSGTDRPPGCDDHSEDHGRSNPHRRPYPEHDAADDPGVGYGRHECQPEPGGSELDTDRDGVIDALDNCVYTANEHQLDTEAGGGDGVGNRCDNCVTVRNADQRDSNGDDYGNACDMDLDNDGIVGLPDLAITARAMELGEVSPEMTWEEQQLVLDADCNGDARVDAFDWACLVASVGGPPGPNWKDDADEDGWTDADDNCPQLANFDQADGDGNSIGDACQDEHPEIASADSISCFDVATDDAGEPHIVYVARAEVGDAKQLRHLYETDAGWMTETLHDADTLLECAADFNHEGELCVAFKASGGDNTQAHYGCLDAAGEFHASKFQEMGALLPSAQPINSSCTDWKLVHDGNDRPNLICYLHQLHPDIHAKQKNHHMRHLYYDGTAWKLENLPIRPQDQSDGDSFAGDILFDEATNELHFVYGLQESWDFTDWLVPYDADLCHVTKHPVTGWGPVETLVADVIEGGHPAERLNDIEASMSAAGDLQVAYCARPEDNTDRNPSWPAPVPGEAHFVRATPSGAVSIAYLGGCDELYTVNSPPRSDAHGRAHVVLNDRLSGLRHLEIPPNASPIETIVATDGRNRRGSHVTLDPRTGAARDFFYADYSMVDGLLLDFVSYYDHPAPRRSR